MLILYDPDTLLHVTVELLGARLIPALESPERLKAILISLSQSPHQLQTIHVEASSMLSELIKATHKPGYLQHIENVFENWIKAGLIKDSESVLPECFRFSTSVRADPDRPPKDIYAQAGYYAFDMSSGIMSESYRSIIASANLAYEGTKHLSSPNTALKSHPPPKTILTLNRPPGHHCDGQRAGGYCYINNAAVAISTWRNRHPSAKMGILDLDFHHGNGTQEIFYHDGQVLYVSIHGEDEFPYYTGRADETGAGNGQGMNLNLPLATGSSAASYLAHLDIALARLHDYEPEFLVVSLGFDTFHLDPLGCFKIETADYEVIAHRTRKTLKDVPTLIALEGGYVIDRLGPNLLSFLKGWEDADVERSDV